MLTCLSNMPIAPAQSDPGTRRVLAMARVVGAAVTLAMAALVCRIVQLQISPPPQLAPLVGAQHSKAEMLGRRGTLVDRQWRILATTGLAHRLIVDPQAIADPNTFPERLGYTLGYDPAAVERRLHQLREKRYVVIDRQLDDEQWNKLERFRLPGMFTDVWQERQYPQGSVGGHIIGVMGSEEGHTNRRDVTLEGAERMFDAQLVGKPGSFVYLRDAGRRPMALDVDHYRHPEDGKPVRLSIDITIQSIAEKELAAACQEFGAKTGEMVILDPNTGEVLAMAVYPGFDPNEVEHSTADIRRNRCVTDPFEPGSTFKPFIWAMATEMGVARPEEMINTDQSVGRALRDTHAHGTISWEKVLVVSSNRGMATVGLRMGINKLYQSVKAFRFGELSQAGIPGESKGQVLPLRKWNPRFSVTSVPMGQEISVTPLQLARAFCVFANGGLMVTPTLLARDLNDASDPRNAPIVERVLSAKTANLTKDVLRKVVTEGTGRKADSKFFQIFGKTGTAQVAAKGGRGYEPGAYNGVFVAGAPFNQPRLVVACVIHKPNPSKGYYGGIVAAPAAMRAIEQSLTYMGVKPITPQQVTQPGAALALRAIDED